MASGNNSKMTTTTLFKIPPGAKRVTLFTRLDGKVLPENTQFEEVGGGLFENGIDIYPLGGGVYEVHTWTVAHNHHQPNFACKIDEHGVLQGEGIVNGFSLGPFPLAGKDGQQYLNTFYEEVEGTNLVWDRVEYADGPAIARIAAF